MNSVYFMAMNVEGDGKDVWPWTSDAERYRFDCSKLAQWEIVFSHMDRCGIMLHHRRMNSRAFACLDVLLKLLAAHPRIRLVNFRHLLENPGSA